ncbi:hypothetical protein A6U96_04775 [Agrobacterium tumefaciens]|nr:hypothetical protein A6U96_04775 [Agrobacterium tumefaciens]
MLGTINLGEDIGLDGETIKWVVGILVTLLVGVAGGATVYRSRQRAKAVRGATIIQSGRDTNLR